MDVNISIKDTSSVQIEEVENQKSGLSDAGASANSLEDSVDETIGDTEDIDAGAPSEDLLSEIGSIENQETDFEIEKEVQDEVQDEDPDDLNLEVTDAGVPPEFDF